MNPWCLLTIKKNPNNTVEIIGVGNLTPGSAASGMTELLHEFCIRFIRNSRELLILDSEKLHLEITELEGDNYNVSIKMESKSTDSFCFIGRIGRALSAYLNQVTVMPRFPADGEIPF
jgi:hypothetical protein